MSVMPESTFDLSAQGSYPTDPQVDLVGKFFPGIMSFGLTDDSSAGAQVVVSFNGVDDHRTITKGQVNRDGAPWLTVFQRVWLRKGAGATVKAVVDAQSTERGRAPFWAVSVEEPLTGAGTPLDPLAVEAATDLVPGSMSAADHAKLASLPPVRTGAETGLTANAVSGKLTLDATKASHTVTTAAVGVKYLSQAGFIDGELVAVRFVLGATGGLAGGQTLEVDDATAESLTTAGGFAVLRLAGDVDLTRVDGVAILLLRYLAGVTPATTGVFEEVARALLP